MRLDCGLRAVALLGGVVLAGCGAPSADESREPPPVLTAAERRSVASYEGHIQEHCVRVAQSIADPGAAPTPEQQRRAYAAADALGALAARKPTAEVDVGQDLRLYLSDVVENLDGSNCDPRLRARLEEALEEIPVQ